MPSGIQLDPTLLTVAWKGATHKLRPKTFHVLEHLLARRGTTVAKQDLIRAVWGDTAVSDDVLVQSITELRKVIEEGRGQPKSLITIPRVGYRLLIPDGEPGNVDPPLLPPQEPAGRARWRYLFPAAGLLIAAALGVTSWLRREPPPPAPIVVLPLENHSSTPELEWLRDGLADMLITSLSQASGHSILSLQEARSRVARHGLRGIRASAIVRGSFASAGSQLRVDLQVLEGGEQGRVVGGESMTVNSPDQLLAQFDELAVRVAGRLGLEHGGHLADVATTSMEAYRLYTLGLEKASAYRNREAIALFERAVGLDPDFAMAHARIGYAYAVTWNLAAEARPHLERALRLSHRLTSKHRLFVTGWDAIARLEFPRAVGIFRGLVVKYPGETEACVRLGHLLRGEDRLEEALRVVHDGLARDPDEAELLELLAGIYAQMGRHEDAIQAARRLVERETGKANALDALGEILQWAGHSEEAEASFRRAGQAAPGFERPVVHLGNLHYQLGRYREAIRQFERYIEMAPSKLEQARGWGRIAGVWWRQGDRERAARAAATELSIEPTAVWNSIVLALDRGDDATVRRLQPRLDEFPYTSRGARTNQRYRDYFDGYIALKQGRTEEALARLRSAVQRPAPYWSMEAYEDCLADALRELGRLEEAVAEYRRALKMNPGNALARLWLARCLQQSGQPELAQHEYKTFAAQWKNNGALPTLSAQ